MACRGNGYGTGCGGSPEFTDVKVTDAQGNTITSAYPGDIVYIKAKIHGYDFPCSNFYLMFYGRNAEYIDCYKDRVAWDTDWWVTQSYGVPYHPGDVISLGALEMLTGVMKITDFEILVPVEEGEASFIWVTAPPEFTPNVPFNIDVTVKNIGGTDDIFSRIVNQDTGNGPPQTLSEKVENIAGGGQHVFSHTITLSQTTYFHCLIQIGHDESIRIHRINVGSSLNPISLIAKGGY